MNHNIQTRHTTEQIKSRREFLSKALVGLGLTTSCISVASILESCEFYEKKNPLNSISSIVELNVPLVPELTAPGIGIKQTLKDTKGIIVNSGYPVIITRIDDNQFVALTGLCTHDACYNEMYPPSEFVDAIVCTCHGSVFNYKDGSVIQGPAVKPLAVFPTSFDASTGVLRIFFA